MIVNKILTPRGWRVVSHSMLAAAGIGLVYLLAMIVTADIRHGYTPNWWILGFVFALSVWTVALGSMLTKAELADWK
jgi:general stress protein CsbA